MQINYFKEFIHSKDHLVLAGISLGIGFISANILILILGVTAYGLGVMFLHDSAYFKKKTDAKYQEVQKQFDMEKMRKFKEKQIKVYESLSDTRREAYNSLAAVCRDIEQATVTIDIEGSDMRLRKIDELMWTYMKLLCIDQSIEVFLEYERKENVPDEVKEAETRLAQIAKEMEELKASAKPAILESKQRLFSSFSEKVEVLKKRLQRIEMAKINVEVVKAEQDRLIQQIKLLRADAMASKNAEALTSRIDASISHLDDTNKWVSQMGEFQDFSDDIPLAANRIGFEQKNSASESLYGDPFSIPSTNRTTESAKKINLNLNKLSRTKTGQFV